MEQSYNVGISTLHGNIIHIDVEAQTLVKVFKQQCIDESQLDVAPLKINVTRILSDWRHVVPLLELDVAAMKCRGAEA